MTTLKDVEGQLVIGVSHVLDVAAAVNPCAWLLHAVVRDGEGKHDQETRVQEPYLRRLVIACVDPLQLSVDLTRAALACVDLLVAGIPGVRGVLVCLDFNQTAIAWIGENCDPAGQPVAHKISKVLSDLVMQILHRHLGSHETDEAHELPHKRGKGRPS